MPEGEAPALDIDEALGEDVNTRLPTSFNAILAQAITSDHTPKTDNAGDVVPPYKPAWPEMIPPAIAAAIPIVALSQITTRGTRSEYLWTEASVAWPSSSSYTVEASSRERLFAEVQVERKGLMAGMVSAAIMAMPMAATMVSVT